MTPSEKIDKKIKDLANWQGVMIAKFREIIHETDPDMTEDWKWETPIYVHNGMVCATGSFKDHVKINFFKGAKLSDPKKLFNNGLESKSHRSIDFKEGDKIDIEALKDLIKQAVQLNIKK